MLIAIQPSKISFSDRWVSYCEEKNIPYKLVDCYASDIINQLSDCDAFMWHFYHANSKDHLFARQLLYSIQISGKKVFPDFNTVWHFDDKVGQKYLFEAIGAPLVPTYVFYSRKQALAWAEQTSFPKVFKLRGGAGSSNVRLVRTAQHAKRLIRKAFGSGFRQYNAANSLRERWRKYKLGKVSIRDLLEGMGHLIIKTNFEKISAKNRGYAYFQDYIPGCQYDIRVKIIGSKCWAFRRIVRENDFRASGSDIHHYSQEGIPLEVVRNAFEITRRLKLQCVAFDYVIDSQNKPLILEMSYGFGYTEEQFHGYWDEELNWHAERFNPFGWMVEEVIKEVNG